MRQDPIAHMRRGASAVISCRLAAAVLAALLAGCSYRAPSLPVSETHLVTEQSLPAADASEAPPPVSVPTAPAPRLAPKLPTYSVVVNEVPVKELLFALARDTKQNIDVHPGITGVASLNAIDETLPAILDRLSRQANLRWKQDGRSISVQPDTPYLSTYRVNYVNVVRSTDSTVGVSGVISTVGTGGGTGGGGGGGGGGGANASSTTVTTTSRNDFWKTLEDNIKSILTATRAQTQSSEERAARAEAIKQRRDERIAQAEAVARAGENAKDLFATAFEGQQPPPIPGDVVNEVVVNPVASTVTVMATQAQHALVREYLDSVMAAAQRQVLIEATIVEVELSRRYQAGVDWGRIAGSPGAGFSFSQLMTAGALSTPPSMTVGYSTNAPGNIFATIKLLEQFGNARVLSSPKLMALNNQTALLKVVRNQVYFTVQSSQASTANVGTTTAVTTTARTVPIGLVMSMTPQINDTGQITLTVRPTVTSQVGSVKDPNPLLADRNLINEIPVVEVREIESVLQVVSGQTAILGGLIKDGIERKRSQVPGLGNTRAGDLFAYRDEEATKSELVIFLRPVVVPNPSLDSDELRSLRRLLPRAEQFGASPQLEPRGR